MYENEKNKLPPFSRSHDSEKEIAQKLLGNFKAKGSRGESLIQEICNSPFKQINIKDLIFVSKIISQITNIHLSRNQQRKKELLVKWYNDNEEEINKVKQYITCVSEDQK